jgi:hypothetical protein
MERVTVTVVEAEEQSPAPAAPQALVEAQPPPMPLAAPLPFAAPSAAVTNRAELTGALVRAQTAAHELVLGLQYQLSRLGAAGQAGLVALIAALVLAFSTLMPARQALQALTADLASAQHSTAIVSPDQAVPHLIASLPGREQIPAVIGQLYAEAKTAGVALDVGHYVYSPPKAGAIGRYDIDFPVKAPYPDIRNFIDRSLTAVPAAALDKLHIERKTVGDPAVSADVGFVVFVRSGPQP